MENHDLKSAFGIVAYYWAQREIDYGAAGKLEIGDEEIAFTDDGIKVVRLVKKYHNEERRDFSYIVHSLDAMNRDGISGQFIGGYESTEQQAAIRFQMEVVAYDMRIATRVA